MEKKKKKFRFRPIMPDKRDVAQLRARMDELIRRMKKDYEIWLKPLVLKMTEEQRKEAEAARRNSMEVFERIAGTKTDSEMEYYSISDFVRKVPTTRYMVQQAIKNAVIQGVVAGAGGARMIPATQLKVMRDYLAGRVEGEEDDPVALFNFRLAELSRKYEGLFSIYHRIASETMKKAFKKSADAFMRQFKDYVSVDILRIIQNEGMEKMLRASIQECTSLIKTVPQEYFTRIQEAVYANMTGDESWTFEGGLQKFIEDLGSVTLDRARIIARDQTMKAVSTFNKGRLENCGVTHYVWRASMDERTAGNPKGLYSRNSNQKLHYVKLKDGRLMYKSRGTDKNKYHGNHWDRDGKIFAWDNPPPDGHPGMGICCRCYAEPLFEHFDDMTS